MKMPHTLGLKVIIYQHENSDDDLSCNKMVIRQSNKRWGEKVNLQVQFHKVIVRAEIHQYLSLSVNINGTL